MPKRPPLPRDPVEARVDGFTHGGEGVVRVEGKAVFVPGTIPGERVRVQVTEDHRSWARAELLEVLEASSDRVEPPCPYVPECGGCDLQHVTPPAQRALKRRVVVEQLERLGGLENIDAVVEQTRAVGPDSRYRTNAQMHADDDGRLGYHRAGTHDVVPVDQCLVLSPPVQALRDAVGDDTGATGAVLRAHDRTSTAAVTLQPGKGGLHTPDGDFDLLLEQPDGTAIALRGEGVLAEEVAGITYRFDPSCFFQVNTGGAEAIVEEVLDACAPVEGALTWDLFAGVGLVSLALARAGAEVVAVERHGGSSRWLEINAEEADLEIAVVSDAVEDFVLGAGAAPPDLVVLDPPRAGAGTDVCEALAHLRPGAVVYVSCDPASLARDAAAFAGAGFDLTKAVPLDLFPMTHHVEIVATFAGAY